jgi:hypothetical protein
MSLNLNALTAYTNEHAMDLIKESILKGRTIDLIQVQGGIKSSATINRLSTDLVAQAGSCGWSATGSTTLDQRVISVCDIKINEAICLSDLEAYYTQTMMNPGSYNTDIPFEQLFAENKKDAIQSLVEDIVWKSDKSTGTGNLALCDGFIKMFDAGITGSMFGTYSAPFSATDAVGILDSMVAKVPTNIIDSENLVIGLSYADYRTYSKALRDANLFHYTGAEAQGMEFSQMVPGTNVRVIALKGLNNSNRIVLFSTDNLYVGTDLLSDAEDFSIFYSEDNDEVRFRSKFKIGVQVAWLEEIVWFKGI